jgi:transcription initiation factor IIE alpha subunit
MGKGSGRRVEDLTKVHEGYSRIFGESKLEKRLREEREELEALEELEEDEDDDYDYICPQCSGSGEGMYDGSSCSRCGGTGGWPKNREVDYD